MKFSRFNWGTIYGGLLVVWFEALEKLGADGFFEVCAAFVVATIVGCLIEAWIKPRFPE